MNLTAEDRIYCALPLCHSAALLLGLAPAMSSGATLIISPRFSATQFWKDVRLYNATIIQYIGELCRYLLAQPALETDTKHRVRGAIGNGLRPDIWGQFQTRFGIGHIYEFYGSTEGTATVVNLFGKFGSVGWMDLDPSARATSTKRIVKLQPDQKTLYRNQAGFCVDVAPNEPGEVIGPLVVIPGVGSSFPGYTNTSETNKKIIQNVFAKDDVWVRTGDLLKSDQEGFLYFVDRIGDTFRWKGENVATTEVANAFHSFSTKDSKLCNDPIFQEVNVYGVKTPAGDGKAGMAAIVLSNHKTNSDWLSAFGPYLVRNLPPYAIPLFLRILPQMEVTATFKHIKSHLEKDGYDPSTIRDPLFFFNRKQYVPLTPQLFDQIQTGIISL